VLEGKFSWGWAFRINYQALPSAVARSPLLFLPSFCIFIAPLALARRRRALCPLLVCSGLVGLHQLKISLNLTLTKVPSFTTAYNIFYMTGRIAL
jgi:hypothetical protein